MTRRPRAARTQTKTPGCQAPTCAASGGSRKSFYAKYFQIKRPASAMQGALRAASSILPPSSTGTPRNLAAIASGQTIAAGAPPRRHRWLSFFRLALSWVTCPVILLTALLLPSTGEPSALAGRRYV